MISGTFTTAPETSLTEVVKRFFDLSIEGIVNPVTILLERSFDNGATWKLVATYTSDDEQVGNQSTVEKFLVQYRLRCTVNGSGDTITYRFGNG